MRMALMHEGIDWCIQDDGRVELFDAEVAERKLDAGCHEVQQRGQDK